MPTRPKTLSRALPQTRTRAEHMVVAGIGGVCPCLRWEERSSGGRAFVPYNRGEQEECRDQSRFPEQKRKITNISRIYNYLTMNSALESDTVPKTCSSAPQTLYVTSTAFFPSRVANSGRAAPVYGSYVQQ